MERARLAKLEEERIANERIEQERVAQVERARLAKLEEAFEAKRIKEEERNNALFEKLAGTIREPQLGKPADAFEMSAANPNRRISGLDKKQKRRLRNRDKRVDFVGETSRLPTPTERTRKPSPKAQEAKRIKEEERINAVFEKLAGTIRDSQLGKAADDAERETAKKLKIREERADRRKLLLERDMGKAGWSDDNDDNYDSD